MRVLAWGITDVGKKREHNEDALLICDDISLFAVADGMGGHQGGERASRLAIQILEREIRQADILESRPGLPLEGEPLPAQELRAAASAAGRTIFRLAHKNSQLAGMGTTLTALYFFAGRAYLTHVGDSRAYLYRSGKLERLTEDHSWIAEQVRSGLMTPSEAEDSALRHVITRSVGFEADVEVDQAAFPVVMGDCFLLCSDGLSGLLDDEALAQALVGSYYSELPAKLAQAANQQGGDDNITVVIIYVANDGRNSSWEEIAQRQTRRYDVLDDIDEVDEFDPDAITEHPQEGG